VKSIIFGLIVLCGICDYASADCSHVYGNIGAGYKFDEFNRYKNQNGEEMHLLDISPISARFEIGVECDRVNFGISHHSQWTNGAPFNRDYEPNKTEIFIDVKFDFWDL
jgi:hypothetical protein